MDTKTQRMGVEGNPVLSKYNLLYWLRPKRYEWCMGFKNKGGFTEYLRLPAEKRGMKKDWENDGKEIFCRWRVVNVDITKYQYLGGKDGGKRIELEKIR